MAELLEVERLTGGYASARPVLHELTFTVRAGEMVGLIDLNGAGKSTTMKHLLGLMDPHRGHIRIDGRTLGDDLETYRRSYAYVPETPLLYDELTVREHLELTAMAYALDKSEYERRAAELLRQFRMEAVADRLSGHLSKGMKQKVVIMSALLVRPKLYLIDEPFLGLDPLGIRSLLDLMAERKREGAGLLISSHILAAIEGYCERFIVLHQGRIVAQGDLEEIRQAAGRPGASLDDAFCALVGGPIE